MRNDFLGTVMFGMLVAVYSAYVALNGLPLLWGTPEMSTTALTVGVLSGCLLGRDQFARHRVALGAAIGTLGVGVAAALTQSDALLAVCMTLLLSLWLFGLHTRATTRAAQLSPTVSAALGREVSQIWRDAAPKPAAWTRDVPSAA